MSARDRFVATRKAVIELDNIHALIMTDGEDWKPPGVHVKGIADPTASRAIRNVDEWGAQLVELRKRESELEHFIGTTLAIIEAVRSGLGADYADLLDARYIDCLTWKQMDVAKSTGKMKVAIAFDWVDSIGISRLLRGEIEV